MEKIYMNYKQRALGSTFQDAETVTKLSYSYSKRLK